MTGPSDPRDDERSRLTGVGEATIDVVETAAESAADVIRLKGVPDPGKEVRASAGLPILPALDGFRAFAIIAIVLAHIIGTTLVFDSQAAREFLGVIGRVSVEVLFVLSGFVVFLPTVARNGKFGDVGSYAARRTARLLPGYWLALAVVIILILIWPIPDSVSPGVGNTLFSIAVLQGPAILIDPDQGFAAFGFGLNGPLWTLSLEVAFYIVLPFIAGAYFRRPLWGLGDRSLDRDLLEGGFWPPRWHLGRARIELERNPN